MAIFNFGRNFAIFYDWNCWKVTTKVDWKALVLLRLLTWPHVIFRRKDNLTTNRKKSSMRTRHQGIIIDYIFAINDVMFYGILTVLKGHIATGSKPNWSQFLVADNNGELVAINKKWRLKKISFHLWWYSRPTHT